MNAVFSLLKQKEILGPLIAAVGAILVFVLGVAATRGKEQRQRRQEMYAEAYRTVLCWKEMVYRVRRRRAGEDHAAELVARFHDLQERIDYYQGWIATESVWVARSYCRFASRVKAETRELITEAWAQSVSAPGTPVAPHDKHARVDESAERFLADVRAQLSPWYFVVTKASLVLRNPESGTKAILVPASPRGGGQ